MCFSSCSDQNWISFLSRLCSSAFKLSCCQFLHSQGHGARDQIQWHPPETCLSSMGEKKRKKENVSDTQDTECRFISQAYSSKIKGDSRERYTTWLLWSLSSAASGAVTTWLHMTYSFESLKCKEELVTEDSFKIFLKVLNGAREMTQLLKAYAALAKNPSLAPSTNVRWLTSTYN